MMLFFRRIYRIVSMFLWMFYRGFISFFFHFGGYEAVRRITGHSRIWGAGMCKHMGMQIHVHGDVQAVKGGLIVSNHQSYLDIFVHASQFHLRFTPKKEIRRWPLVGPILGISRPIWVNRDSPQAAGELIGEICRTMDHGISLLIYPEGTTGRSENGLKKFKSAPFEAAMAGDYPIYPVLTLYGPTPDGKSLAWVGDDTLMPHLWRVLGYKRVRVDMYILEAMHPQPGENRKILSERVRQAMQSELDKLLKINP